MNRFGLCRIGLVSLLFLAPGAWGQEPEPRTVITKWQIPPRSIASWLGAEQEPRTTITKWQDGKQAAVSLTFDDNSINQFRVAMPLLNERGFKGTFFIITGDIPGSKHRRSFVGRPLMEIIRESETVPTSKENALERMSMLVYLERIDSQQAGSAFERGRYDPLFKNIDEALAKLRQSGTNYQVRQADPAAADTRWHGENTWDAFRRYAAMGHEFASHTVTHPYMTALDDANIRYELEKPIEDIREQLGPEHTFSVECPYAIGDNRLRPFALALYAVARNWVTDDFSDGILRGNNRDPASSTNAYVQWQREPRTSVTLETQKGWVDKSLEHGIWLVVVYHGFEGVGWEAVQTDSVRVFYDYLKEKEPRLWIATYKEGTQYTRERMAGKVTARCNGSAIEVTVTHSLDPKRYDLPLTVRTTIPSDWRVARFRQGEEVRWVPVHREAGETFVLNRIKPNGVVATLERGDTSH